MTEEIIKTIAFSVVGLVAIQSLTVYAVVRLLITGRALFERRETDGVTRMHRVDR